MSHDLDAELNLIWQNHLDATLARVAEVEAAGQAMRTGKLGTELHAHARERAHELIGVCATFGRPPLARLARQCEELLLAGEPDGEHGERLLRLAHQLRAAISQD